MGIFDGLFGDVADEPDSNKKQVKRSNKQFKTTKRRTRARNNRLRKRVKKLRKTVKGVEKTLDEQSSNLFDRADKNAAIYDEKYLPAAEAYVDKAMDWASPARKEEMASEAGANTAFTGVHAREALKRDLQGYGIDPTEGAWGSVVAEMDQKNAAATAAAMNEARRGVDEQQMAYLDAVGQQGLRTATLGDTETVAGVNIAQQKVNNRDLVAKTDAATRGTAMDWDTHAAAWNEQAGNLIHQQNQDQAAVDQINAQSGGGFGSLLGFGAKLLTGGAGGVFAEEGGAIPVEASPSGGAIPDDVRLNATPGEFVVPDDVVAWKGEEFFQKLITSSREKKQGGVKPEQQGIPA